MIFRHYLRRLGSGIFGPLIFVVLPVLITTVLSFIYTRNAGEEIYVFGYNMVSTHIARGMMILFQLNSGIYLLNYLNYDFFHPMGWRLKAAPCRTYVLVLAAITSCMVFTVLQGVFIITATAFLIDVYWGSLWVAVLVVVLLSLISQFLNMLLFFLIRNAGTVEGLSWLISLAMAVLSGVYFPLPDNTFFRFIQRYGTPFALAQTAIKEAGFLRTSAGQVGVCLTALLAHTLILMFAVIALARREWR